MIQVGLVGVGPLWNRFRPALSRLRRPIQVEAVYDPVFARAEKAAEELDADFAPGLQALASRGNVEALLVMDPGWATSPVLSLLSQFDKPIFSAPFPVRLPGDTARLDELIETGEVPIVPAMWRRFTPAAIRLQELLATELGIPLRIEVSFEQGDGMPNGRPPVESLVGWMDFCRSVIRAFPTNVSLNNGSGANGEVPEVAIEYPAASLKNSDDPSVSSGRLIGRQAFLKLSSADAAGKNGTPISQNPDDFAESPLPGIVVKCLRGEARIQSADEIEWRIESGEWTSEHLTAERTPEEIMLDVFCRRVVGGLIPVADLHDIQRPIEFLTSCGLN